MNVSRAYKQTEMGMIPETWDLRRLGDISSISAGATPSRTNPEYWNGDIPWVTTSEVDFGIIREAKQFITKKGLDHSAARLLPPGTLLMALYGQGKTRGKIGVLGIKAATNQACAAIELSRGVSREFVFHFLASRYEEIRSLSNSGSQENLNSSLVRSIPILLPPLPEQRAITEALGDVDALIDSLEQLIAKKRDIKQAAMQQLLTGRTRLPGFSGEWEAQRLGSYGSTYGGLTGKTKADFGVGSAKYITFMNIMSNPVIDTDQFAAVRVLKSERQNRVVRGDLFFNGSSETPEEVGMCSVLLDDVEDVFLNSFCFGFRLHAGAAIDGRYLAYFFRSDQGRELLYSLAQGATRYNLSKTALLRLEFLIPQFEEQVAISAVISDMDTEISALEARLIKTRDIKQGMMQELLTGRTRLV